MRKLLLILTLAVAFSIPTSGRAAQFPNSLWLGTDNTNNLPVLNVDRTGAELRRVEATEATGIAIDVIANRIYFGVSTGGFITGRDLNDPATPLVTLQPGTAFGEDLAFDGTSLWQVEHNAEVIQKIDPTTGNVTFSFPLESGFVPLGLAWDGSNFWVSEFAPNGRVVQYTPAGVATGNQFTAPLDGKTAGGLAFDSTDSTLWIGTGGAVVHVTTDGTVLGSFLTPDNRFVDGLEFQPAPPECTGTLCMVTDKGLFLAVTGATAATGTADNGIPLPLPDLGAVQGPVTIGDVTLRGPQLFVGAGGNPQVVNQDWTQLLPGPDIALAGPGAAKRLKLEFAQPVYALGIDVVEPQAGPNVGPRFSEATFTVDLKRGKQLVQTVEFNPANDVAAFFGVYTAVPFDTMTFTAHAFGAKILGIPLTSVTSIFSRLFPDIVVVDKQAGTLQKGALFRVEADGSRSILTDFGDSSQGPLGLAPSGAAMEATGNILVIDGFVGTNNKGALFRVNPITQIRTILSDFGNPGQGVLGYRPVGVAVEANSGILVVDPVTALLSRVNPQTGARTIVSNFGRGLNQGLSLTGGVAVEADGRILVADSESGTNHHGALFRVHPGFRTLLSDFGKPSAPGEPVVVPVGVAVEANGNILVVGPREGLDNNYGVLFRIDPQTGVRTIVSDFGDITKGFRGRSPVGVAVEATGNILVVDESAEGELLGSSVGTLFRIDPVSGFRTQLSFFKDPRQGPLGEDPLGVAVRKR